MNNLPKRLPIWPGAPGASSARSHIHQRHGPDCAIAAAATIAGVSYEEAASAAFSLRESGLKGMRRQEMIKLLERLTDMPWRLKDLTGLRQPRLGQMKFPDELVVAGIIHPWFFWRRHALAARGRVVYDGSLDRPTSPQDHPYSQWYVDALFIRGV
jgi:hypothetical protein